MRVAVLIGSQELRRETVSSAVEKLRNEFQGQSRTRPGL